MPARLVTRFGSRPLTVAVAPAGFGKSTVLHSWRSANTVPSPLVAFDPFDRANALDAGWALVAGLAVLGIEDSRAEDLIALLPPDGTSFGSEFVRAIADQLRAIDSPFVLFLDDVHGLAPDTAGDLGRLVSMVADDDHRIVVATRQEPPWPVHRWEIAGFADILTADELRLTPDEIADWLGADRAELAAHVAAATDGWPAALEAVRWHLDVDPSITVDRAVLDLVDYVNAEVLPALAPADLLVLRRTAILEPFPPRVATAVTETADAPAVLARAARRTSLVTRLPDGRFAYHAVLREALRRQLGELEPDIEGELHRRAADAWLDEADSFTGLTSAVDHLIAGQCWGRAVGLLRRRWAEFDVRSRLDLLVQWLEAIPGGAWRDDAEMMLVNGWANLRTGRANRALDGLQDPTIVKNARAAAVARVLYASTISWTADPHEALTLCERAHPELLQLDVDARHENIPTYPGVTNFELAAEIAIVQSYELIGRLGEATDGYRRVLGRRAEIAPLTQIGLCGAHAWVLAMCGETSAASARAGEALQIAAETGAVDHVRTVPALLGLAVAAILHHDRATAEAQLDEAASRCRPTRAANLLRVCDLVGAMHGAQPSYLADVEPPLAPAHLPFVDQFVVAASARRRAELGDTVGAEAELRSSRPNEFTMSTWIEVLLANHVRHNVARWLDAQPLPTHAHGRVVRHLAEAATTKRADDAVTAALAATEAAAAEQLIGVLVGAPRQLWSRPEVVALTDPLLIEAQLLIETQRRLVASHHDGHAPTALTRRELDLLRLLPLGLTVDELADRLFVSRYTVKWHRANLYRKLGVRRRADAIDAAAERGLLDRRH